jgi:hypothetical protein
MKMGKLYFEKKNNKMTLINKDVKFCPFNQIKEQFKHLNPAVQLWFHEPGIPRLESITRSLTCVVGGGCC